MRICTKNCLIIPHKYNENYNNMGYSGGYLWIGGAFLWWGVGGLRLGGVVLWCGVGEVGVSTAINKLNNDRVIFEVRSQIG